MPRLKALHRYWKKHPPLHRLVEAYLAFKAPADDNVPEPRQVSGAGDGEAIEPSRTPWLAGARSLPASDALRAAGTPEEALDAAARMFYGNLKEL